jgi:hypothetical protein
MNQKDEEWFERPNALKATALSSKDFVASEVLPYPSGQPRGPGPAGRRPGEAATA